MNKTWYSRNNAMIGITSLALHLSTQYEEHSWYLFPLLGHTNSDSKTAQKYTLFVQLAAPFAWYITIQRISVRIFTTIWWLVQVFSLCYSMPVIQKGHIAAKILHFWCSIQRGMGAGQLPDLMKSSVSWFLTWHAKVEAETTIFKRIMRLEDN